MSNAKLTTHILDTAHGCPAANVGMALFRIEDGARIKLVSTRTNADGRTDTPLLEGAQMMVGVYEIEFHIGEYFREKIKAGADGVPPRDPPFLDIIPIRFGINDASAHYHVPLLASPFSYSTYRGS